MERDTLIAQAIDKFVDSEYAIDDPEKGFDCLNSLLGFYKNIGVDLPTEFEGWNLRNYGKKALQDPTAAHKQFERYVQTLGREISFNFIERGDLIILKVKDLGNYAAIYLGNGHIFAMFDKGGRVCPVAPFKDHIVSVRRLITDK